MQFCTFASGSSGNCALVSHGRTHLLLDAGISFRRITASLRALDLEPADVAGILITHEHTDHVCALKTLAKHLSLPVFASRGTAAALRKLAPELTPCITEFDPGETFVLGDVEARSFPTPHDTPQSVGYRLEAGGRSLAFATDMGCVTQTVWEAVRGVDAAVIEANHDLLMLQTGPYPYVLKQRILSDRGHLSNDRCGALAAALVREGATRLLLAHLSRENNTPRRAYGTVCQALAEDGILPDRDVALAVAPAAEPCLCFSV